MSEHGPALVVFGGSFDPIHHGHLCIAEFARQHSGAERVIFLPTARAPHRNSLEASVNDRLAMLRLAIASNPYFAIDGSDIDDGASGYTVDVLPRVRARYPDHRLSFLVGEDSLTRSHWHRFDDVVAMTERFMIAPRDTAGSETAELQTLLESMQPQTRARLEVLAAPRITISATAIRDRVLAGRTIRYLVPDAVRRYIGDHDLYRES